MANALYDLGRTTAKNIITVEVALSTSPATLATLLSGVTWPDGGDGSEIREITLRDAGEGVQYADNNDGDFINVTEAIVLPVADPLTKIRLQSTSGTPTVVLQILT